MHSFEDIELIALISKDPQPFHSYGPWMSYLNQSYAEVNALYECHEHLLCNERSATLK